MKSVLVLIPARGGSKGIPYKNIKPLNGKPLINYTLDLVKGIIPDEDVCVSTDDEKIIQVVEEYGIKVPFIRPDELASDTATSSDVILHAIKFYQDKGKIYDYTLLLQPTSPLRTKALLLECLDKIGEEDFEMIVSVKLTDANPYYVLAEEDENGILRKSKEAHFTRRQDCPNVWEYNGAFYLINNKTLLEKKDLALLEKKKLVMDAIHSLDIDTPLDWVIAESIRLGAEHLHFGAQEVDETPKFSSVEQPPIITPTYADEDAEAIIEALNSSRGR